MGHLVPLGNTHWGNGGRRQQDKANSMSRGKWWWWGNEEQADNFSALSKEKKQLVRVLSSKHSRLIINVPVGVGEECHAS